VPAAWGELAPAVPGALELLAVDRAAEEELDAEDDAEEVSGAVPVVGAAERAALLLGVAVAVAEDDALPAAVDDAGAVVVLDVEPEVSREEEASDSAPIVVVPESPELPTREETGRCPTSSTTVTSPMATAKTPAAVAASTGQRSRRRTGRRGSSRDGRPGTTAVAAVAVGGAAPGRAAASRRASRSRAARSRAVLRRSDSL
jgi:hypothetical protein